MAIITNSSVKVDTPLIQGNKTIAITATPMTTIVIATVAMTVIITIPVEAEEVAEIISNQQEEVGEAVDISTSRSTINNLKNTPQPHK